MLKKAIVQMQFDITNEFKHGQFVRVYKCTAYVSSDMVGLSSQHWTCALYIIYKLLK